MISHRLGTRAGICLVGFLLCCIIYTQTDYFRPSPVSMIPKNYSSQIKPKERTKYISNAKPSLQKKMKMKKNILCVTYLGRTGNNMYQFAAGYAISKKKGLNFVIEESNPITEFFNIPIVSLSSLGLPGKNCSNITTDIEDQWHSSYDFSVEAQVSGDCDILLDGYFQSWKYWIEYEEDLRKLFTFKANILKNATERIRSIPFNTTADTVFVGIHVRRGDYVLESIIGRTLATERYFKHAINYFRKKYSEVVFLVVSDSFWWCKFVLGNESNLYFMEDNLPAVDMAIMSLTNHTIISVGSFSWWSGWLANGTTIYYQHLTKKGSHNAINFRNNSEYVYPGWIPML